MGVNYLHTVSCSISSGSATKAAMNNCFDRHTVLHLYLIALSLPVARLPGSPEVRSGTDALCLNDYRELFKLKPCITLY